MIAFATYDRAPEGTADDLVAADRIAARCGAAVEPVVWNAPSVAWGEYTAVLVPGGVVETARESASILARVAPGPLLYARLDGVVSDGTHAPAGTFLLMEAELIEPMLFFGDADAAGDRFAEALARKLALHGAVTP